MTARLSGAAPGLAAQKGRGRARLHPVVPPWQAGADAEARGGGRGSSTFWTAGHLAHPTALRRAAEVRDIDAFARALLAEPGQFGCIIETDDALWAAVDRVQGYPVFLKEGAGGVEIATDASVWLTRDHAPLLNERQARLFLLSGYCIGRETLLDGVTRVLPGECVLIDKASGQVERHRYYVFRPSFDGEGSEQDWHRRLGAALDAAIERLLVQADGRRIWLPLSAGYDSRAILAKLLEHGYGGKVETFSYGTPGNMEARVARRIAAKAGVPWRFVSPGGTADMRDFREGDCARYMLRAGSVHTTPAVTEFHALKALLDGGEMERGEIVTNGQSGDYLTGGHIPTRLGSDGIPGYIWGKHFALFPRMEEALDRGLADTVLAAWSQAYFPDADLDDPQGRYVFYLTFEWQERQCRYVVNQQRAYDWLGLEWRLPLWDGALMDLFARVPLALQMGQELYVDYLMRWNHGGLFDEGRQPYTPWPRYGPLIRGAARMAGLLLGAQAKEGLYKRLYYFSDYHYLYRYFGWRVHAAFWRELRNPASLFALDHLARVRQALGVKPAMALEVRYRDLLDG